MRPPLDLPRLEPNGFGPVRDRPTPPHMDEMAKGDGSVEGGYYPNHHYVDEGEERFYPARGHPDPEDEASLIEYERMRREMDEEERRRSYDIEGGWSRLWSLN